MTITLSAFLVVLILGIMGIVWNIVKEAPTSTFWLLLAFWVTCLANLWGGRPL